MDNKKKEKMIELIGDELDSMERNTNTASQSVIGIVMGAIQCFLVYSKLYNGSDMNWILVMMPSIFYITITAIIFITIMRKAISEVDGDE